MIIITENADEQINLDVETMDKANVVLGVDFEADIIHIFKNRYIGMIEPDPTRVKLIVSLISDLIGKKYLSADGLAKALLSLDGKRGGV